MARVLGLVLAIIAGTAAALLLASGVPATYAGDTASCASVISAAAVDSAPSEPSPRARLEAAACHDALVDRTELAGVALLICVAAATVGTFSGRELQPA